MASWKKEKRRKKGSHLLILLVPIIYPFVSKGTALIALGILIGIDAVIEYLRLKNERFNRITLKFFGLVHRREEAQRPSGFIYTLAGIFLTVAFFEKRIAIAAILILALGDLAAAFVGMKYGKYPWVGKKTAEGSLAFFFVAFGCAVFFVNPLAGLMAAILGMLIEALPIPIPDNLTIPVFCGLVMTLLK